MLSFDGIPEETSAERAWRQARASEAASHPEAVEDSPEPETPQPASPDLERYVDQLVRWGGYSKDGAMRALMEALQ